MAADDPAELGPRAVVLSTAAHASLAAEIGGWLGELGYSVAGEHATAAAGMPVVDVAVIDLAVVVGTPARADVDRVIIRRHAVPLLVLLPDAAIGAGGAAAGDELSGLARRADLIAATADDRLDAALRTIDLAAPRWGGEPLVAAGRLVREPRRWRRALDTTASNCNRVRTTYRLQTVR